MLRKGKNRSFIMNIQWYPGHMTKARRMMQEDIKLIDIVIELVDARLPLASKNPDIDDLAKGKARLILLNKSDMADPKYTKLWEGYFKAAQKAGSAAPLQKRKRIFLIILHFPANARPETGRRLRILPLYGRMGANVAEESGYGDQPVFHEW